MRKARVYVKTDFHIEANTRPIHVLSMAQGLVWLGFTPQYKEADLSLAEILQMARGMVTTHYTKNKGKPHILGRNIESRMLWNLARSPISQKYLTYHKALIVVDNALCVYHGKRAKYLARLLCVHSQ